MGKSRAKLILEQVLILAEAFGLTIGEARQQIYVEALMDLDPDKIKSAVRQIINTRTFAGNLPTIAEIREVAEEKIPLDSQAAIAWDKFIYAVRNHCPYDSVKFDDPIISHIITNWGGWSEMGDWPEDETHFRRREFYKVYEAYAKNYKMKVSFIGHHIGLTEYENTKSGFVEFIPRPVMITWEQGKIKALPYEEEVPRVRMIK